MNRILLLLFILPWWCSPASGQANGKLQMHFIDVGQGDAALLISPSGETVLFDEGVAGYCNMPVNYLLSIGVTKIDYLVTSHYHDDHIGCTGNLLDAFPLQIAAWDRGGEYNSKPFQRYLSAVGTKRRTAQPGDGFKLDEGTEGEVTVRFLASNGAGHPTTNENDLSLVTVIRFGNLDIMMGGDLSGYNTGNYDDIESIVATTAPQVEVYKVHHHCSRYSTNTTWLDSIKPLIGIISASGDFGKDHGHPTSECLQRLHNAGVRTYWTEPGGGARPDSAWDVVGGNIVIESTPGNCTFTVTCSNDGMDTYRDWECREPSKPLKKRSHGNHHK